VQSRVGLESPRVEIGVERVWASVSAHSGQYRFAGGRAHRHSPLGTWVSKEIELQGL
jgi:hypothetical protein